MGERFMNPDFLREFIEIYRAFPCLWQMKSEDYLNKCKKSYAYNKLAEHCKKIDPKADIHFVKSKIKNLRTVFRKEFKKVELSKKSGEDEIYVPKLWYYDLLAFIADQETQTDTRCSIEDEGDESERENEDNLDDSQQAFAEYDNPQIINGQESNCNLGIPETTAGPFKFSNDQQSNSHFSLSKKMIVQPRKRKHINVDRHLEDALQAITHTITNDEFDAFGTCVALHLKKLPLPDALELQTEILRMISQKRIQIFRRTTTPKCPVSPGSLTEESNTSVSYGDLIT